MKKNVLIFGFTVLSIFFAGIGLAEEGEFEEPAWFPLFELGGTILGIIISIIVLNIYLNARGGVLGNGFKYILWGVVFLTLGIAFNGLNEVFELLEGFYAELTFEIFIYLGMIFIGIGTRVISKITA